MDFRFFLDFWDELLSETTRTVNIRLNKIKNLKARIIYDKFINYSFTENNNEINVFFNKEYFNLIGWQTLDIYQNLSITFLSSVIKNQNLDKDIFVLPKKN